MTTSIPENLEKQFAQFLKEYKKAVHLLQSKSFAQGKAILQTILSSIMINTDNDIKSLKKCTLISLAQAEKQEGNVLDALRYYHQAVNISDEFNIWLKMSIICEQIQMLDQSQYCLKNALRSCPRVWIDKVLQKLLSIYKKNKKQECIKDLQNILDNPFQLEKVLLEIRSEKVMELEADQDITQLFYAKNTPQKPQTTTLNIVLYKNQQSYQFILSIIYVLLKCKSQRTFFGKKYLKKYQSSLKEWSGQYNPALTSIKIRLQQSQNEIIDENVNQNDSSQQKQNENNKQNTFSIKQLIKDYLNHETPKKKRKRKNQQSKNKKTSINHHRTIYSNFPTYIREITLKNSFNIDQLHSLRKMEMSLQSIQTDSIFDKTINPLLEDEKNEEKEVQLQEKEQTNKNSKTPMDSIVKEAVGTCQSYLSLNGQNKEITFHNVYFMAQIVISKMLQSQNQMGRKMQQPSFCLLSPFIKKLLIKVIVKLLQNAEDFIPKGKPGYKNISLLQLLVDKYEEISYRTFKSKQFKNYQMKKLKTIANYIKHNYEIETILNCGDTYCENKHSQNGQYSEQFLRKILRKSLAFVKFYTIYENIEEIPKNQFAEIYQYFIQYDNDNQNYCQKQFWWLQRSLPKDINVEIQKRQKKAALKEKTMNSTGEEEKALQNIQELMNQGEDHDLLVDLANLFKKLLTTQSQLPQVYLNDLSQLLNLFFRKLSPNNQTEFNSRVIASITQYMKIEKVINETYTKFSQYTTAVLQQQLSMKTLIQVQFLLLKLYILNCLDEPSTGMCFKLVIFLANLQLKRTPTQKKKEIVPQIVILFDKLIHMSKNKQDIYLSLQKKYYQIILSRHIREIYYNGLIEHNENLSQKILSIFQNIYYSKDKQFIPKKIDDAIGYFIYLSKAHRTSFQCKEIDLSSIVSRIFKKCYKQFAQKNREVYKLCQRFLTFQKKFVDVLNIHHTGVKEDEEVVAICQGKKQICSCCKYKDTNPELLDVLYIIGKYFETQQGEESRKSQKQKNLEKLQRLDSEEQANLDQRYYIQLLLLNFSDPQNWINLVRINSHKVYRYFDSLITSTPLQIFKNHFLVTKKLLKFIDQHLGSQFKFISENLTLINTLKIYQRKYFAVLAKYQYAHQNYSDLNNKFLQGLKQIEKTFISDDVRFQFLGYVELRIPMLLTKIKQLVDHKMTNKIEQINTTLLNDINIFSRDVLGLLYELLNNTSIPNLKHLQEDLVIQYYIFFLRLIEIYVQKITDYFIETRKFHFPLLNEMKAICEIPISADIQDSLSNTYKLNLYQKAQFNCQVDKKNEEGQGEMEEQSNQQNSEKNAKGDQDSESQESVSEIEQQNKNNEEMKEQENSQKKKENQISAKVQMKEEVNLPQQKQGQQKKNINEVKQFFIEQYIMREVNEKLAEQDKAKDQFNNEFPQEIYSVNLLLQSIVRLLQKLPRSPTKRYKYKRSVISSLGMASRAYLHYSRNIKKSKQIIKDLYNLKNEDIVFFYHHCQRQSTEKNEVLAEFYDRKIVYMIMKLQLLQLLIDLFYYGKDEQNLIALLKKFAKNLTLKSQKAIFCHGLVKLLNLLQQLSKDQRLTNQKNERVLRQWQSKLKKVIDEKPEESYTLKKLQNFIKQYEEKYKIKITLKKKKQPTAKDEKEKTQKLIDPIQANEDYKKLYSLISQNISHKNNNFKEEAAIREKKQPNEQLNKGIDQIIKPKDQ